MGKILSGSLFYNYKGHFSVVLFALVDANYQFMFVDIGKPGSFSDAKIWQDSKLKQALDCGALDLPDPVGDIHYHFIGDDIFPLTTSLMKPFSRAATEMAPAEKIFNDRSKPPR